MDRKALQKILTGYINGTATPEEIRFLENYYGHFDQRAATLQTIAETELQHYKEEVLEQLHRQMNQEAAAGSSVTDSPGQTSYPVMHRVNFLRRAWFRYAAVILFIFGSGAYFYYTIQKKKPVVATLKPVPVLNDVAPGGQKAILTLSDGSTIVLDSAANGLLTQQGNANVMKLANGQIAYHIAGQPGTELLYNTMKTPVGGQYKLRLPDGTDVWLNAASSITYPTVFTGKDRMVTVTGEAYFEVAKDKAKPFRVKVNEMEVEVLGTRFNINSYSEEAVVKTTLLEGSVKVRNGKETAILTPGLQAQVSNENRIKVNEADVEQAVAWKNGYFRFNRVDVQTVMRQIARWYDVEVVYEGIVSTDKFVGELPMDANISQVLRALEKIEVHFKIEGKKIIVMP
jgi:ferric-dicitrate binding protein FerR (iron transport regulator)